MMSKYRREKDKIYFGILLYQDTNNQLINKSLINNKLSINNKFQIFITLPII